MQEADKEYYSREMAAYTGDLNTYRKLLLMQGVWKSEKRLYLVIQDDTEGLTFFYSLDKEETAA